MLTAENRYPRRKPCTYVALSTINFAWIGLGLKADLHGERPANERLGL